ncbi:MAG: hypothetical protein A3F09_01590 [Chlamydiae bacterium RIFCSPHIGHO2_12_FULL_49_11]|nr:MAG: hypothetical protein A3F09_01590 [Chlamydiae bacterium RIFCSPHIGHO2_12_FULL_49_11]
MIDLREVSLLDFSTLIPKLENGPLSLTLDLGIRYPFTRFLDARTFATLELSLRTFTGAVLEPYKDHVTGITLYQGSSDFSYVLEKNVALQERFESWIVLYSLSDIHHARTAFGFRIALEYLEKLSSFLPYDIPVKVVFTDAEKRPSFALETLTCDAPSPLSIVHPYAGREATIGLVIPPLGQMPYEETDRIVASFTVPFRPIREVLINQMWHGIDELVIFPSMMQGETLRMLRGFEAAGGCITSMF